MEGKVEPGRGDSRTLSSSERPPRQRLRTEEPPPLQRRLRHRTIFISDVHLGTHGCKAALLADFLLHNDCKTLYLVGDIVDGWRMQRNWFWNASHSAVLNLILRKVEAGTRVVFIPGNHDEVFRAYCGLNLAGIELMSEAVHETANGRRMLVIHGDRFDGIVTHARWLARLGDRAYTFALAANDLFNAIRRRLGLPYWSLSAFLKRKVKNAASFISNFEQAVAREARSRGADGVIAGHIHHAELKFIEGILYCNDGDWVESCTALTEDARGKFEIVSWTRSTAEQAPSKRAQTDASPAYVAA